MSKPRMIGMQKPYVKNARGDRIHIKNKMHFARGSDKPQQPERPWEDARTCRREFEVREITVNDIIETVKKMKEVPVSDRYFFCTDWVKPYVSDADCIQYFANNGSVVVYDSMGRCWHRGILIEGSNIK